MVIDHTNLSHLRALYEGKRIVLGAGVFDLIHSGHLGYIQSMRRYGDIVVLMVKADKRVRKYKDPTRPIIPEGDRVRMVAALKGVDYAFIGPDVPTKPGQVDGMHEAVLTALRPDAFCSTNPAWEKLEELGVTRVIIGRRRGEGISTTKIIQRVQDRA
jgi:cytidyltransferase-like protein